MNNLIADSGATKTEWRLESDTKSETFFTEGLSPYYHTTDTISEVIDTHLKPDLGDQSIDRIFFYGAGCDSPERDAIVKKALHHHFSDADIEVNEDLLAAARACCGDEPGIACILGTGSNSCRYDGEKITEHIPPLAFILGDEASAGYFGKKLINSYFRREIPDELQNDLEENYKMSLSHIMLEL
jgi:N-acetylglucosamine kinase-like BadF-type ATPase